MKRILALLLVCCVVLSGCADRKVEEELLVIVLAIDKTKQDDYTVAVKVPANSSAGEDSPQQDSSGYMLLQATGHSFTDAISMLNATTPRRLNFSQVREIVIGDQASKEENFDGLLQQIDALPRFRCSAAVIICKEKALSFAEEQKPLVGMRLSRYAENTLASNAGKGFTPNTDLCAGVRDLGYGFCDPLFILGAVNDFSGTQQPGQENSLDDLAGNLPRKSMEAIEMFGAAATNGISVSGYLTGYEMALLHLLEGHVEALTIQINDIPLHITAKQPAVLSVDIDSQPILLGIELTCNAEHPPGSVPNAELVQDRLNKDIFETVSHLQAMRCDGLAFGDVTVKKFLTVHDWEAFRWREKYAQAKIEVNVTVQNKEK